MMIAFVVGEGGGDRYMADFCSVPAAIFYAPVDSAIS